MVLTDLSQGRLCRVATECGYLEGEEINQVWSARIIATSLLIAICGAFTCLTITSHLRHCRTRTWYIIFVIAAGLSLGVNTVWSMHFVGMQALQLKGGKTSGATQTLAIEFEVSITLVSGFAAWIVGAIGIHVMSNRDVKKRGAIDREMFQRLFVASALIATGVIIVHYAGMLSQTGAFSMDYDPLVILASAVIAAVAVAAGLVMLMVFPPYFSYRFWCSVIISAAVNSVHYTGMTAATYYVTPRTKAVFGEDSLVMPINGMRVAIGTLVWDLVMYAVCQAYGEHQKKAVEEAAQQQSLVHEQAMQRKIAAAVKSTEELGHPFITIPAKIFLNMDIQDMSLGLEGMRLTGQLKYFDRKVDIMAAKLMGAYLITFSYEPLSWVQDGPNLDQLRAMKAAVKELAAERNKDLRDVYIWVDCLSLPKKNKSVRASAVNCVYTFAGLPDCLVVICPDSVHSGTQEEANADTVKSRLWCRVEHLVYGCSSGTRTMFLHRGHKLEDLPKDWMESICNVFEAESACCRCNHNKVAACEMEIIVQPLIALFYDVVARHRQKSRLAEDEFAYDLVQRNREQMFPGSFIYKQAGHPDEERELFGDILERIEGMEVESMVSICRVNVPEPRFSISSYEADMMTDAV